MPSTRCPARLSGLALLTLILAGCTFLVPQTERVDVQQGDLLAPADIRRVEIGQTRKRVRELLGEPLVTSPFHEDRWDYIYYRTGAGLAVEEPERLTLYFNDRGRVTRIVDHYQSPLADTGRDETDAAGTDGG